MTNAEEASGFVRWFDSRVEQEEKILRTRALIASEQRLMEKTMPVRIKDAPVRQTPVVLTNDQWRALLTSGKTRRTIIRETGCSPRTVDNRAEALGLPLPA